MPQIPVYPEKRIPYESSLDPIEVHAYIARRLKKWNIETLPQLARQFYLAEQRAKGKTMNAEHFNVPDISDRNLNDLLVAIAGFGWSPQLLIEEFKKRMTN